MTIRYQPGDTIKATWTDKKFHVKHTVQFVLKGVSYNTNKKSVVLYNNQGFMLYETNIDKLELIHKAKIEDTPLPT